MKNQIENLIKKAEEHDTQKPPILNSLAIWMMQGFRGSLASFIITAAFIVIVGMIAKGQNKDATLRSIILSFLDAQDVPAEMRTSQRPSNSP